MQNSTFPGFSDSNEFDLALYALEQLDFQADKETMEMKARFKQLGVMQRIWYPWGILVDQQACQYDNGVNLEMAMEVVRPEEIPDKKISLDRIPMNEHSLTSSTNPSTNASTLSQSNWTTSSSSQDEEK